MAERIETPVWRIIYGDSNVYCRTDYAPGTSPDLAPATDLTPAVVVEGQP